LCPIRSGRWPPISLQEFVMTRAVSTVLCACLVVAAGGCGKVERRTDADRARQLVTQIVRKPDVRRVERALSRESAAQLAKFSRKEQDEYLTKIVRQLARYTDADIRVTTRPGERHHLFELRKPQTESICLAIESGRYGTPALDLSESIDTWRAIIDWSPLAAERMTKENAGRPRLTIEGIEMLTTFDPEIFRFGIDVAFPSCDGRAAP
jgi:hypothetical protein